MASFVQFACSQRQPRILVTGIATNIARDLFMKLARRNYFQRKILVSMEIKLATLVEELKLVVVIGNARTALRTLLNASVAKRRGSYLCSLRKANLRQPAVPISPTRSLPQTWQSVPQEWKMSKMIYKNNKRIRTTITKVIIQQHKTFPINKPNAVRMMMTKEISSKKKRRRR
jgi:hypothetical protein